MKLSEVAKHAGVSLATVSRILNNDTSFSVAPETVERVLQSARELGYEKKSRKATKKRTAQAPKETLRIGYVLTMTREKFQDYCFSHIIYGIEQEALDQGYTIVFSYGESDLENPQVLQTVLSSHIDGLILIGSIPKQLFKVLSERFPQVTSDRITVEFEKPFYELTKLLIERGRRNIAFIGGDLWSSPQDIDPIHLFDRHDERFIGYLKAHYNYNIPINKALIKNAKWEIEESYNLMTELLTSGETIDAVAAASDKMAIGAMRAIREFGLTIPDDISIIGFDNLETANFVTPRLTTVNYPKEELGRLAVRILSENITGKSICKGKKMVLPSTLVIRDSI
jgi:DNA-binding LacI/PurR family transcriptional regulator